MQVGSQEYKDAVNALIGMGLRVIHERIKTGDFDICDLERLDKIARLEEGRPTENSAHSFEFLPVESQSDYGNHVAELEALGRLFNGQSGN